jgi:hypothetical protein
MGFVYPGLLRQIYQVPSAYKVHPQSSLGVVQFQFQNVLDARSYDPDDIGLFSAGMNEKIHVDKIVGPFNAKQNSYEPTLDMEVCIYHCLAMARSFGEIQIPKLVVFAWYHLFFISSNLTRLFYSVRKCFWIKHYFLVLDRDGLDVRLCHEFVQRQNLSPRCLNVLRLA